MNKATIYLLCIIFSASSLLPNLIRPGQAQAVASNVGEIINNFVKDNQGSQVTFIDVSTNKSESAGGSSTMQSASLYKLFVAKYLFEQRESGNLSFDTEVNFLSIGQGSFENNKAEDDRDGTPYPWGDRTSASIKECLPHMISESENVCGAVLKKFVLDRGANSFGSTTLSPQMTSTADVSKLLAQIATGTYVNKKVSAEIKGLLSSQIHRKKIPAGIPSLGAANKTGEIHPSTCDCQYSHDAAIVQADGKDYILAVMTRLNPDSSTDDQKISKLAADIFGGSVASTGSTSSNTCAPSTSSGADIYKNLQWPFYDQNSGDCVCAAPSSTVLTGNVPEITIEGKTISKRLIEKFLEAAQLTGAQASALIAQGFIESSDLSYWDLKDNEVDKFSFINGGGQKLPDEGGNDLGHGLMQLDNFDPNNIKGNYGGWLPQLQRFATLLNLPGSNETTAQKAMQAIYEKTGDIALMIDTSIVYASLLVEAKLPAGVKWENATTDQIVEALILYGTLGQGKPGTGYPHAIERFKKIKSELEKALSGAVVPDPAAGGSGCACTTEPTGSNNIETAYNFFVSKGLSPIQSAALVGNFMQESGVDPKITNSRGAHGIAQWLGGRLQGLNKFAAKNGHDPDVLEVQLEYVWYELNNNEKAAGDDLKNQTEIEEATLSVRKKYERPGESEANDPARLKYAQDVLAKYGSNSPGSGGVGSGVGCVTPVPSGDCKVTAPVWGSQNGQGDQYSESQLRAIFGDPGTASDHSAMDANLETVDFNGHSVSVHKLAAGCLKAVAQEIKTHNIKYDIKQMGCYRYDSDNGSSNIGTRSYHTYGVACDINWDSNPFVDGTSCDSQISHDMPQEYVTAFHNHGFTWGGYWCSVKDYMHFEFNGIKPS